MSNVIRKLNEIIETFQSVEPGMRLELMLDYSRRLPLLPQKYHAQRDAGVNRVSECMTPVFLWIEPDNSSVRIYVDIAEEAPTAKGFLSVLIEGFKGAGRDDLLERLGLSNLIRMNRAIGLASMLGRVKRAACEVGR